MVVSSPLRPVEPSGLSALSFSQLLQFLRSGAASFSGSSLRLALQILELAGMVLTGKRPLGPALGFLGPMFCCPLSTGRFAPRSTRSSRAMTESSRDFVSLCGGPIARDMLL